MYVLQMLEVLLIVEVALGTTLISLLVQHHPSLGPNHKLWWCVLRHPSTYEAQ